MQGCTVSSNVAATPRGEETKQGAINRAVNSKSKKANSDIYIGIESGLVKRYGDWYEEVWVAIYYKNNLYTAYSSGIKLPVSISSKLKSDVSNHPELMDVLRQKNNIDICSEWGVDTWGNYTGTLVNRNIGLEEAIRNALVQIFPGEKSFY